MSARHALALLVLCTVGCGASVARAPIATPAKRPTLDGAVLLALPGGAAPFVVSGATADVVRGRVRWHVEADGSAVRRTQVTAEPIASAVSLPAWLGGGVAYLLDDGLAVATPSGPLRPLLRGNLGSLSIGAHELWARERVNNDWLRIDPGSGKARREAPPIAAPILAAWSSAGTIAGRGLTAGPEFFGPTSAIAIVDLLGPVLSRDGGDTWSPLDRAVVNAAFPAGGPKRIVREGTSVAFASDDRMATVGSGGTLGAPVPLAKTAPLPEVAALRIESEAPFGVPLADDELLLADSGRFAVVQRDPLRVVRVSRALELQSCQLVAGPRDVLAACVRHENASGGQLVLGTLRGLDAAPKLDVERTLPFGTGHRFAASSALVVASSCLGGIEGGLDLLSASKFCVRDVEGRWTELGVGSVAGRRHVVPRSDGGVLVAREDTAGKLELLSIERGAAATTTPLRLRFDERASELVGLDETAPGRVVAWFRTGLDLRAAHVEVGNGSLRVALWTPRKSLDAKALVGTWADRAMVLGLLDGPAKKDLHVDASVSTDGGRTWSFDAWPKDVRPQDISAAGKRVDCGPMGCRTLGWSRLGWHKTVAAHDAVLELADAPLLPPPPPTIARAKTIAARCTALAPPQTIPLAQAPVSPTMYPFLPNDVLLGLPGPKLGKDQSLVLTPVGRHVRGGLISVGPALGPWGDAARTVLRFATDLDPLGAVNETAPFALFADRNAATSATYSLRAAAWPLGPKRIVLSLCTYGRCDVWRASPAIPPERVELPSTVTAQSILGVRELGSVLAVLGTGWPVDVARLTDPQPFVALVSPQGVTVSFLSRASWASESQMAMSVEPVRGAVGVLELTPLPPWTHGTGYVLPIGSDARPSGAFELLVSSTPDVARPVTACGGSTPGWDDGDATVGRTIAVTIDGGTTLSINTEAGVLRSRMGASDACLERITALSKRASFQFDAQTGKALLFTPAPDGKTSQRHELACSITYL